jgi:hypothetical protein
MYPKGSGTSINDPIDLTDDQEDEDNSNLGNTDHAGPSDAGPSNVGSSNNNEDSSNDGSDSLEQFNALIKERNECLANYEYYNKE